VGGWGLGLNWWCWLQWICFDGVGERKGWRGRERKERLVVDL